MGLKQYKESKMEIFGRRLREVRKSKKLTQKEVADFIGKKCNTISDWENNKTFPSYENLVKLADIFEVSLDWLVGRK